MDGKFFSCGGHRFRFRGVTYGTFRRRDDGFLFPAAETMARDVAAMSDAGFNLLRTYTPPPPDLLEMARRHGMKVLAGAFFEDWRYMLGTAWRERAAMHRRARSLVKDVARAIAGDPAVAALTIGNEVPADVVRWIGHDEVGRLIEDLVEAARAEDPQLLITYGSYPTTEYLVLPALDFVTFNVFLEVPAAFRAYLRRLHNLSDERPLVLGEIGLDAGQGEQRQAEVLDWQLQIALEQGVAGACVFSWTDEWWVADRRVEGWSFGLTTADRTPRPALEVTRRWNERDLPDLDVEWPSISVVICAHNAERTLEECLQHTLALDYPELEVVVVDDGSSDATAEIAGARPEVKLLSLPPQGLAQARNEGAQLATGEIVAYLDSDAFPAPEWPYLLALAFDSPRVGGVGGPNLPPVNDPYVAQAVARSPGGPVHVLLSDDRAEHVPGCNMAFWRQLVNEVGGFDPIFRAAGDDVDFCWRVLDAGWEIAFHPSAFVWHHRRSSVRAYLRQQRGYGRAEALVQDRHPERFTRAGTARWRGIIYDSMGRRLLRPIIYRGAFGSAAFQSIYRSPGHGLDLAHQLGAPLALALIPTALLALVGWPWAIPAVAALLSLIVLALLDARTLTGGPCGRDWRIRWLATALHLIQPVQRLAGRIPSIVPLKRRRAGRLILPGPARRLAGGVVLLPLTADRPKLTARVLLCLSSCGFWVSPGGPWDSYDGIIHGSLTVHGRLVTSAHPEGSLQARFDVRPWRGRVAVVAAAILVLALTVPALALVAGVLSLADAAIGIWRSGPRARRAVMDSATGADS